MITAFRHFWSNRRQRRRVMWAIGSVSLLVFALGAFLVIDGHLNYTEADHELTDLRQRHDQFIRAFPTAEVDGEIKPDLTDASETDLRYVAMLRTEERRTLNRQIDAENRRGSGLRVLGAAIVGFALAYLVAPEGSQDDDSAPEAPA